MDDEKLVQVHRICSDWTGVKSRHMLGPSQRMLLAAGSELEISPHLRA